MSESTHIWIPSWHPRKQTELKKQHSKKKFGIRRCTAFFGHIPLKYPIFSHTAGIPQFSKFSSENDFCIPYRYRICFFFSYTICIPVMMTIYQTDTAVYVCDILIFLSVPIYNDFCIAPTYPIPFFLSNTVHIPNILMYTNHIPALLTCILFLLLLVAILNTLSYENIYYNGLLLYFLCFLL